MPGLICLREKLWTRTYSIGDQVPTCPVFTRAKIKSRFRILVNLPSQSFHNIHLFPFNHVTAYAYLHRCVLCREPLIDDLFKGQYATFVAITPRSTRSYLSDVFRMSGKCKNQYHTFPGQQDLEYINCGFFREVTTRLKKGVCWIWH